MSCTVLLLTICALCCISLSHVIQPTVSNATGEYYIADKESFIDNVIHCDSTKNCYTICPLLFSCSRTSISCSSPICNLQCSALKSCVNTQFNVLHSNTSTTLLCSNLAACYNTRIYAVGSSTSSFTATLYGDSALVNATFTIQDFTSAYIHHIPIDNSDDCVANTYNMRNIDQITILKKGDNSHSYNLSGLSNTFIIHDSNNINMTCIGQQSCIHYQLIVNSSVNTSSITQVNCIGDKACHGLDIVQSAHDTLELNCVIGDGVCLGATLLISPLFEGTRIICNATQDSHSCNDMHIIVPYHHENDFLFTVFVDNDPYDDIPHPGTLDGFRINCLGHALCTNYTSFPILYGAASPSKISGKSMYFEGNESYQYQFQSISCREGQECFIECNKERACSNALIECEKGSKCHIYCDDAYDCDNFAIKAFSNNIELVCGASGACNDASIWLPPSFDNGFLDVSTCNEYNSCDNMEFMCGDSNSYVSSEFELNNGRYLCQDETCCPWNTLHNDTFKHNVTCVDSDCIVNCNNVWGNPYYPPIGCSGLVIDATASNNLYINCTLAGSCTNITIFCPTDTCHMDCGEGSCAYASIQSEHAKHLYVNCRDQYSCHAAGIKSHDNVNLTVQCNAFMSCNDLILDINVAEYTDVRCNEHDSCRGLKVYSNSHVNKLNIICNRLACQDAQINSTDDGNVSLICTDEAACVTMTADIYSPRYVNVICLSTACQENKFDISKVEQSVELICSGSQACVSMDFTTTYVNGSVTFKCLDEMSCSDNTFSANYVNDSVDLLCNTQRSCKGLLHAEMSNRLNIHTYGTSNDDNFTMDIHTPILPNTKTYLYCTQFGCNFLKLSTAYGLSDIDTTFAGDCSYKKISDYVTKWSISCDYYTDSYTATYNGDYCSGNSKCCSNEDVERIEDAFDEYYYYGNGDTSKACSAHSYNKSSNAGMIAGIIIGIVVVALIGWIVYSYYRNTECWRFICFVFKRKVKREKQPSEDYISINAIN